MIFGYASIQVPSPEEQEVKQRQIDSVFETLEVWFQAIEDGTAEHRLPDPGFTPPPGRPAITDALVDEFISELDREIDIDAFGYQGQKYKADATSEFHRLAQPQRMALIQDLLRVLKTDEEMVEEVRSLEREHEQSSFPEAA